MARTTKKPKAAPRRGTAGVRRKPAKILPASQATKKPAINTIFDQTYG